MADDPRTGRSGRACNDRQRSCRDEGGVERSLATYYQFRRYCSLNIDRVSLCRVRSVPYLTEIEAYLTEIESMKWRVKVVKSTLLLQLTFHAIIHATRILQKKSNQHIHLYPAILSHASLPEFAGVIE